MIELNVAINEIKNTKKSKEQFLSEVIWQGENLLNINASAPNKYVTCLMEKLFTYEERLNGYIDQFWKVMKRTANRKCLDTKLKSITQIE